MPHTYQVLTRAGLISLIAWVEDSIYENPKSITRKKLLHALVELEDRRRLNGNGSRSMYVIAYGTFAGIGAVVGYFAHALLNH
jgi:hypothetical protein